MLIDRKSNRYLLYATGEIGLIIVGILIALQINNWNEQRIEQNEIRELALNLYEALDRDLEMLEPVEMQMRASIRQAQVLADYFRARDVSDMDNAELFFLTRHIGYRPYGWNRAALEQLKSAGGLRRMRNRELAQRISDYDALSQHLDQDYVEDELSARDIWESINQLVDTNYDPDGLEDVLFWDDPFSADYIEQRLTRFRQMEQFQSISELGKPLLSEDPAAFRRLANLNREFADNVKWRPESELPRLRGFAHEIREMIAEEYR